MLDRVIFRILLAFVTVHNLSMELVDVVTAYLYGKLDFTIYLSVPELWPNAGKATQFKRPGIQILKSLYGLKQAGRLWFKRLAIYLTKQGFKNNEACPCIFVKTQAKEICIVAIYVDDLNIIGTQEAIRQTIQAMDKEFELKKGGRTKFCIGWKIEDLTQGKFVHQGTYLIKLLQRFRMNECTICKIPMEVRSLNPAKDSLGHRNPQLEESLDTSKYYYPSLIGGLMYLANNTRPDISFATSLLSRYLNDPCYRHWKAALKILRYLKGTIDYGLLYRKSSRNSIVGYSDASYQSEPSQ